MAAQGQEHPLSLGRGAAGAGLLGVVTSPTPSSVGSHCSSAQGRRATYSGWGHTPSGGWGAGGHWGRCSGQPGLTTSQPGLLPGRGIPQDPCLGTPQAPQDQALHWPPGRSLQALLPALSSDLALGGCQRSFQNKDLIIPLGSETSSRSSGRCPNSSNQDLAKRLRHTLCFLTHPRAPAPPWLYTGAPSA